jgi:hypothetical protein
MTSGLTRSSNACWKLLSKEGVFIGEIGTRLVPSSLLHILLLSSEAWIVVHKAENQTDS